VNLPHGKFQSWGVTTPVGAEVVKNTKNAIWNQIKGNFHASGQKAVLPLPEADKPAPAAPEVL